MLGVIGEGEGLTGVFALAVGEDGVGTGAGEIVSVLQAVSHPSKNARIAKVDWFFIEFLDKVISHK